MISFVRQLWFFDLTIRVANLLGAGGRPKLKGEPPSLVNVFLARQVTLYLLASLYSKKKTFFGGHPCVRRLIFSFYFTPLTPKVTSGFSISFFQKMRRSFSGGYWKKKTGKNQAITLFHIYGRHGEGKIPPPSLEQVQVRWRTNWNKISGAGQLS